MYLLAGCSGGVQQSATSPTGIGASVAKPKRLTNVATDDGRFLTLINAHRSAHGLAPVRLNGQLKAAAQDQARRAAKRGVLRIREHSAGSLRRRVSATGYPYAASAENLVRGRWSEDAAFAAWKKSAGHNRNMLMPFLTEIGLARTDSPKDGKAYWALILGRPKDAGYVDSDQVKHLPKSL